MKPRYRRVELLKTGSTVASVIPKERTEDFGKCLKFAARVFGNTYESRKGENGSDYYFASTRTFMGANNFSAGDVGMIMVGHFVEVLLNTFTCGKTVEAWLLQQDVLPTGAIPTQYYSYAKTHTALVGCSAARDLPAYLPTNDKEYFDALRAVISGIQASFSEQRAGKWNSADIEERVAYVRALYMIIDSRVSKVAYDSFSNYVREVLSLILRYMLRTVCSPREELPMVEWKPVTTPYDMYEMLNKADDLLDMFRTWYHGKLESDLEAVVRKVYQLDLSAIKVENGVIQSKDNPYDHIIDYALNGALSWSQEAATFDLQWQTLKTCYDQYVKYGFVLDHEHSKVTVPNSLRVLFHGKHSDFEIKGTLIEIESQVSFWNKTLPLVLSQFNDFVSLYFEDDAESGYVFPNASVRKTVKNGIPSYYRFDFSSSVRDTFMELKLIPFSRPSGQTQYDAEPLGIFNVEQGACSVKEDRYVQPMYERMEGTHFFGTNKLTKEEMNAFVDQFRTYEVLQAEKDRWLVEYRKVIYTIKPPLDVAREFDIYAGSTPRGVPGIEYKLIELPVATEADVEKLSMLDLWFAVRIWEVNNQKEMESVYKKRVAMFGTLKDFMPSYKITDFTGAKVGTPMYGALLALGGRFGSTALSSIFSIRPQYFGAPIGAMVKGSKFKRVAIPRLLKVVIPVALTAVNKDYISKANGKVIFKSSETRFKGTNNEAPFFILEKEPFDDVCWKNYIKGTFTLDLAVDVEFPNATKVYRDTDQIELYLNSGMPGFDSVNAGFDEKYCVIGYNREDTKKRYKVCSDFSDFYSSPLLKNDVTQTFYACLKNAYLEALYFGTTDKVKCEKAASDVTRMVDWMCKNYNIDNKSIVNVIPEFYSDVTIQDVRDSVKLFGDAKQRDDLASFFKKLYSVGGDALKELPELAHPDCVIMLDSALYGAKKFLRNSRPLSVHLSRLPGDLIKEQEILEKMVEVYASRGLNLDAINV
jgi:hypothetical protein